MEEAFSPGKEAGDSRCYCLECCLLAWGCSRSRESKENSCLHCCLSRQAAREQGSKRNTLTLSTQIPGRRPYHTLSQWQPQRAGQLPATLFPCTQATAGQAKPHSPQPISPACHAWLWQHPPSKPLGCRVGKVGGAGHGEGKRLSSRERSPVLQQAGRGVLLGAMPKPAGLCLSCLHVQAGGCWPVKASYSCWGELPSP